MCETGQYGWISRFCYKHPLRFFSVREPIKKALSICRKEGTKIKRNKTMPIKNITAESDNAIFLHLTGCGRD